MSPSWLDDFLDSHHDELVAFRHHLHAHPELSHQEHETTDLIAERLRVAGLEPVRLSSGTGLTCDLGSGDGPIVALRGDIDALRMDDTKDVAYRSTVAGVSHGCGHDLHATIVLGAGLALATKGAAAPRVRLIFEPAEESVPGGAVTVIADGALEGVGEVYGFHADPKIDVGQVGVRTGQLTAAADIVEIELHGPGGHTARPQLTVDLVALAARVVTELPDVVARTGGSDGPLSVVFGALRTGHAANVIPTTALLRGTVRTPDPVLWARAESIVCGALAELLERTGARFECSYQRGVPPVVNDGAAAARAAAAAAHVVGADHVVVPPRSLGGDSFAWYQEHVPGCYLRLGVHDPAGGHDRLDLHSGAFDVDDRAIELGVRIMAELAARDAEHVGER